MTIAAPTRVIAQSRRTNLRKMYAAEIVSGVGDGVMWVALVSSLADEPRPGLWLGIAVVARLAPRAVLSLPAGAMVDRAPLRPLLVGADVARAVVMFAVAWLAAAGVGPTAIILGIFMSYVLGAPTRPGLSAALPRVSGETRLAEANAILSTLRQLMTFVGPFVGVGVVMWSTSGAYAINAATFLASAALLLALRDVPWPTRDGRTEPRSTARIRRLATSFVSADGVVKEVAGLRGLIGLIGAMYFVRGAEMVLWALVVRDVLDEEPASFGYLAGAVGLGAVLATPLARRGADSASWQATLVVGVIATAIPTAALAFSERLSTAILMLMVVGAGMVLFEVVSVVTIQRTVATDRLGRVFGVVNGAGNTGKLIGAVAAPLLVVGLDVDGALIAVAALLALCALAAIPAVRSLASTASARRTRLEPVVDALAALDLFDGAPRTSLERLAGAVTEEEVPAGTVLIREGDEADDLFIARTGTFDVTALGEKINEMKSGAWFGEIGLIDHVPRTATVVTTAPATIWRIPGDAFVAVLEDSGSPPIALVEGIADRLAAGRAF